jgi:hypothetical protein
MCPLVLQAGALEGVTGPLQGLLATAAGCDARVLRAGLVRLAARAAGAAPPPGTQTNKCCAGYLGPCRVSCPLEAVCGCRARQGVCPET